jgi:hypothetical protein
MSTRAACSAARGVRGENGLRDLLELRLDLAHRERAGQVRDVAIDAGTPVDNQQVTGLQFTVGG